MAIITEQRRAILSALMDGMRYRAASLKLGVSEKKIREAVNEILQNKLPELYANLSSDGKITVKELRDHRDYIKSVIAMDDV